MITRPSAEKAIGIALLAVVLIGAALGLALRIGIWLPDVVCAARHTLASKELPSGHKFRVVQYWNRVDFYNTELIHVFPNGRIETSVLDGDDNKTWEVPLVVDESNKVVRVTLGGGRERTMSWQ
jgi:hypothetical protein